MYVRTLVYYKWSENTQYTITTYVWYTYTHNIKCICTIEADTSMSIPTHYELTCMRDDERSTLSCDGTITGLADSHPGLQCWRCSAYNKRALDTAIMCIYVHNMYVCKYVRMYVCTLNVCIHMNGYTYSHTYVRTYIHMYVPMYVCMYSKGTYVRKVHTHTYL